ncbi:hypothetical protein EYF80_055995 [Liparis tanakae]|uniref:Uncharacterized protein n=1 Tax=Liparis tanakae TaxID=230148 RepID=A0A4Z2EY27_9TELE|nr:hypothetical protein EYF80_055995 [Liparis tanakae]
MNPERAVIQQQQQQRWTLAERGEEDYKPDKPGGMGPPGMPSFGGMLPITGLGAAAALWKRK